MDSRPYFSRHVAVFANEVKQSGIVLLVIANEVKQSSVCVGRLDCFTLFAMTATIRGYLFATKGAFME
jgi:hypothetical protein